MKQKLCSAGLALAAAAWSSAGTATTVTAVFDSRDGNVQLTLVGEADAVGTAGTAMDVTDIGMRFPSIGTRAFDMGSVQSVDGVTLYNLTSMSYSDTVIGQSYTTNGYVGGVVNDLVFEGAFFENGTPIVETRTFDLFFAEGSVGDVRLLYWSLFPDTTISAPTLEQVIQTGFDDSFTFAQGAEAQETGAFIRSSAVALESIMIDTDPDPGNGGGGTGSGGGSGSGSGTPDIAPVPLPASAMLLLAGLGGFAALRRRA